MLTVINGAWPSGLGRLLWEQEIGGSNPLAPTILVADLRFSIVDFVTILKSAIDIRQSKIPGGYSIMVIMSGFQPENTGSIPVTRSGNDNGLLTIDC